MPDPTNPAEHAIREARNREEWQFRKRVLRILAVTAFMVAFAYFAGAHYFSTGKIMAESQYLKMSGQPIVKIREFGSPLDDNPPYRFEYYSYGRKEIWSCQSFRGHSYTANSAQIEWSHDGTATVFLDHDPKFTCKEGVWSIAERK